MERISVRYIKKILKELSKTNAFMTRIKTKSVLVHNFVINNVLIVWINRE